MQRANGDKLGIPQGLIAYLISSEFEKIAAIGLGLF
jgi:hypothetical protein